MSLLYVAYDLDKPGQNYPNLWQELKSLGAKRIQDSLWALNSASAPNAIAKTLWQHMDSNDRLLVVDSATSSWFHLMSDPNNL